MCACPCVSTCTHLYMCVYRSLCLFLWTCVCADVCRTTEVPRPWPGPPPPSLPLPDSTASFPKDLLKHRTETGTHRARKRMQGRCLRLPVSPRTRYPHPSSSCPLCPTHLPSICLPQAWHTTAVPGIPAGQQQAWACSNTTRTKGRPLGGSWGAQLAGTWHHWPPFTPTPASTTGQTPQLQPSLPPLRPPCPDKLFKSSIRKCKKYTRTQTPGPAAPTGAAAGKAHLKRERDRAAAPAAAACLPHRQRWHNFPTRDRGLSPRAAQLGVEAAGENRGNC